MLLHYFDRQMIQQNNERNPRQMINFNQGSSLDWCSSAILPHVSVKHLLSIQRVPYIYCFFLIKYSFFANIFVHCWWIYFYFTRNRPVKPIYLLQQNFLSFFDLVQDRIILKYQIKNQLTHCFDTSLYPSMILNSKQTSKLT